MEFIQFEATEETQQENQPLNFSDANEDDQVIDEIDLIDDNEHEENVSFDRSVDINDANKYNKFPNQARDPRLAAYEDSKMFFSIDDTQPELYAPENRERVAFDFFKGSELSTFLLIIF